MATSPATAPEIAPKALARPFLSHSIPLHPRAAAAAPKCGDECARRQPARGQSASGIESEPSYPQQASADKAKHQAVRRHRLFRVAAPFAQVQRADQRRYSRGNVHYGPARKIQAWEFPTRRVQETAFSPDHVRQGGVYHQKPERQEEGRSAEFHALRRRAGNQRRGDNRKHELVNHESRLRNGPGIVRVRFRADAAEECVRKIANDRTAAAKRQAVPDQSPQDRDQSHHGEALHHDRQRILAAHETAVEERQSRSGHHQHQRRADEHPGIVSG